MAWSLFRKKDKKYYQELTEKYKKGKEELKKKYAKKIEDLKEELAQELEKLKTNYKKEMGEEGLLQRKNQKQGERNVNIVKFITLLVQNKLLDVTNDKDLIKTLEEQMSEKKIDGALDFLETEIPKLELDVIAKKSIVNSLTQVNKKQMESYINEKLIDKNKLLSKIKINKLKEIDKEYQAKIEKEKKLNMFKKSIKNKIEELEEKVDSKNVACIFDKNSVYSSADIISNLASIYATLSFAADIFKTENDKEDPWNKLYENIREIAKSDGPIEGGGDKSADICLKLINDNPLKVIAEFNKNIDIF